MYHFADAGKTNPIPQRDTQYAIRDTRYKPNQTQPVVSLPVLPVLSLPKGACRRGRTYFKRALQKKLVFQALVFYKMQQTGQIGSRKFNASPRPCGRGRGSEAVFGAGSVGTI